MDKDQHHPRILLTGDYPALESSFVEEVRDTRTKDPFHPLLILVSSKLLGLHLRRLLVDRGAAHFNLRFKTLEEFAREIAGPHLLAQGKTEIPRYVDELLIGHLSKSLASQDQGFYFSDISDRQGFHRAILATIKDLKDGCLSPQQMEAVLNDPKIAKQVHLRKLKDLLSLWRSYERRLQNLGWYDESEVLAFAGQGVKDSIILRQASRVILYGFYDFNIVQKQLLHACFGEKETVAFLPYEPTHAFDYVKPAFNWLRDNGFKEASAGIQKTGRRSQSIDHLCHHLFDSGKPVETPPDAIRIISAPGERREIREVLREILRISREKEIPFHEIGVLLRSPEGYSRLFRETFDGLGISPYLREGRPLRETHGGRSLLMLLNIVNRNFSRQSVMEFATFARLQTDRLSLDENLTGNLARWDAISIQAGVVEGQREWEKRLRRLRSDWSKKLGAQEEDEGKRRFQKEDLIALDLLIQFLRKLFGSVRQWEGAKTWSEKVESLLHSFEELVDQDEEDLLVKQAVRSLSELDVSGIPPSSGDFIRLINEILKEAAIPQGRFQRNGPTVVNLMAARGVPFKVVVVPGLVEKSFPPMIRQDAILLDQERKVLNQSLSGKRNEPLPLKAEGRLNEERLLFRLAAGSATQQLILSYPRIEIGTGKERLPSSFLLALIKALTGKSVDFNQIESYPGFVRIPLSEIAVNIPGEALDEMEFDLSIGQEKLAAKRPDALLFLQEISPFFEKGLGLESSRWGKKRFTSYDGILDSEEAQQILCERYSILKKNVSPTRLETYASCPFQYLLSVIMGIEGLTEPEKEATITPLDKGKLIHDILYEFYANLKKERGPSLRLKPEDRERLAETAQEKFSEFEQIGVTGYPMLWEAEKRSMIKQLGDFFNEELRETEFIPTYFEVRYGMNPFDSQESDLSTEEPVSLKLNGKTLNLRGRIDRIDLTKDGAKGRVRDYKTGSVSAKPNEFQGGRTLQLPLYLYAARQLLGSLSKGIQIESAEYVYLKEGRRIPFEGFQLDEREGELQEILETLAQGIEKGIFIPVPDNQDCKSRFCDFRAICGSWAPILFSQKSTDPMVKRFLEVTREMSEEVEE